MYENIKTVESGGISSFVTGFLKGSFIGVVLTLLVFAVFAVLLSLTSMSEDAICYIAYITEALAAGVSGFVPAKKSGKKGILTGFISGGLYMLAIWIISSLAADGFFFDRHVVTMIFVSAAAGAVGGIAGVNTKTPETNKKKKQRFWRGKLN